MMTRIIKIIHRFEHSFDVRVRGFTQRHPYLSFLAAFVGMPLFILTSVLLGTMAIILPISWMMGW